jgi:hypothetical protein
MRFPLLSCPLLLFETSGATAREAIALTPVARRDVAQRALLVDQVSRR